MPDFDLLDLLAQLERPPLTAPAAFTTEVFSPEELERTRQAWIEEHGHFGALYRYHGWITTDPRVEAQPEGGNHDWTLLQAWLGCHGHGTGCCCVGGWVMRAQCSPCGWLSPILSDRDHVVATWHDHAWPGWRDLPAISTRRPQEQKAMPRWIEQVEAIYPPGWGRPGAPIVTARQPRATRSVPGRSPWGGFDLADQTRTA